MKKVLFSVIIYFIITISQSCSNGPESNLTITQDSSQLRKKDTLGGLKAFALLTGNFPQLLMSKTDIESLLGRGGSDKKRRIVFQFFFPTTEPSPLLIAYGAKKVDEFHIPGIKLIPSGLSNPISSELILGNLDLPKKKYEDLKAIIVGGVFTHMQFMPVIATLEGNSYLRYKVDLVVAKLKADKTYEVKNLTATFTDQFLNPCPPKRPCGDGIDCDADTQN